MSSSCSFRITRTAEDLAQTIAAISQKLVKLEQRLEALEMKSIESQGSQTDEELVMLDGVDQLLQECKGLLSTPNKNENNDELWVDNESSEEGLAA